MSRFTFRTPMELAYRDAYSLPRRIADYIRSTVISRNNYIKLLLCSRIKLAVLLRSTVRQNQIFAEISPSMFSILGRPSHCPSIPILRDREKSELRGYNCARVGI